MWPRIVELMLGAWLVVSPFILRGTPHAAEYTTSMAVSGAIIMVLSLLGFWRRAPMAHLGTVAVALWLVGHGYLSAARPGPAAAHNEITMGLVILLFAILPNDINEPPVPWRRRGAGEAGA